MSWEGFDQNICENGHYFVSAPDYDDVDGIRLCPECRGQTIQTNTVDQTNGSYDLDDGTRIDGYRHVIVVEPPVRCVCPTCHTPHDAKQGRYRLGDRDTTPLERS